MTEPPPLRTYTLRRGFGPSLAHIVKRNRQVEAQERAQARIAYNPRHRRRHAFHYLCDTWICNQKKQDPPEGTTSTYVPKLRPVPDRHILIFEGYREYYYPPYIFQEPSRVRLIVDANHIRDMDI